MSPDGLRLGPLFLPWPLAAIVVAAVAGHLIGMKILKGDEPGRGAFRKSESTAFLSLFLGWKLSVVITAFPQVIKDPSVILYHPGNPLNVVLGGVTAVLVLAWRWRKERPGKAVYRAMAILGALVLFASGTFALIRGPIARRAGSEDLVGVGVGVGQQAPAVELMDPDGAVWSLAEGGRRIVVLNFWASWCPPCRAETPELAEFARDSRFDDVDFRAVNVTTTEADPNSGPAWLAEKGWDLPVLMDVDGSAGAAFEITSLPTTVVIDADGRIRARKTGAVSRSWVASRVRESRR